MNGSEVIDDFKPDIVHLNVGPLDISVDECIARGIPHIWHLREFQSGMRFWPSEREFRRKILRDGNWNIAITRCVGDYWNLRDCDEVIYDGETYGITDVILNLQPDPANLTCTVMIWTTRGDMVKITLPVNFLDGNAHGFSQSSNLYMEYDGHIYSKATGYSGTITVAEDGETIRIEATNYDNLKITYEGPYEEES